MSLEHISVSRNLFLSACFCWDSRLSFREIDQKNKVGGIIGYADLYLEWIFCHSKHFNLYTIPSYAAGALQEYSDES